MSRGANSGVGEGSPSAVAGREPLIVYFLLGLFLGVLFIKSEVASWYRIQEMFRFQSFHMYGVIASAVAVGALSVFLMKRAGARTAGHQPIDFSGGEADTPGIEHAAGGTIFGLGWGLVGACPGPLYALIGAGHGVMVVGLLSAMAGVWFYGLLRPRLPHGPLRGGGGRPLEATAWQ